MIPCAVARNIETMLIARFLDGLAGSAFLSVAGGTVGDMFAKHVSSYPPLPCLYKMVFVIVVVILTPANTGTVSAYDGVYSQSVRYV
jgi:MFS family permease